MNNQGSNQSFQSDDGDDDRIPEGRDGRSKDDGEVLDLDDLLEQSEHIQAEEDAKDSE